MKIDWDVFSTDANLTLKNGNAKIANISFRNFTNYYLQLLLFQ